MAEVGKETVDTLRGAAADEPSVLEGLLGLQLENLEDSGLDAGATPEDVLGVLVAVAPHVGIPRVVATAPALMRSLGLTRQER